MSPTAAISTPRASRGPARSWRPVTWAACRRPRCRIGRRVIVHGGSVIGADGFGFIPGADHHRKIPQVGIVVIEDDVEIGANTTIDRATLGETVIGRGSKLDNLVQVGHNVEVG